MNNVGDHIGGMMKRDSVVFPKAEVYASRPECEAWVNGLPADKNAFQVKTMDAYKDRLHLFEFDDVLQLEHPEICATYDMDKESAVASRKHFLRYAKDNGLTMTGMHLLAPAFIGL